MSSVVLIVDDSLTVRMDLAEAFEAADFVVIACATVAEARLALAGGRVDLVVLDVLLTDEDGVELLREIRVSPSMARLPILMLSSEAQVKDRVQGLVSGADEYVGKPYDRDAVVTRGRELVDQGTHAESSTSGSAVLIIDDSPTFRAELRRSLEEAGYSVQTAVNGQEGLRLAAAQQPTAVIVDGVMPGIDGPTVIRRMRLDATLRGTPCLLLTASEDGLAELRAMDSGADAFVRKDEPMAVILARLAAVLRSAPTHRRAHASLVGPKRILAVDDSMTYLQELTATLGAEGYDVALAHSGEEALEMLALRQVDCILLDMVMPGLGGKEACRIIKSSPGIRDIPLIIITALEEPSAIVEGLAAGADDYIPKSSDFEVLNARVRAQIRRKQFADEHRAIQEELRSAEVAASEERAARKLADTRGALADELERKNQELEALTASLERKNQELEAFSYSVSHDLRTPLRHIDGFSQELLELHTEQLDPKGKHCLERVRAAVQRMSELIDDLLQLAQLGKIELTCRSVNLSEIAQGVADSLCCAEPARTVRFVIAEHLVARADPGMVRILFENLLGNAWKFSSKTMASTIEFGAEQNEPDVVYFVRDNGAGFDMAHASKLFSPFQRLHGSEFEGTGIGLATVHRIVDRHRGRVWVESAVDRGTTIFFTLPSGQGESKSA